MSTSIRAALALIAAGALIAGFAIGTGIDREPKATWPRSAAHKTRPSEILALPTMLAEGPDDLREGFEKLAATLPAEVGVAVSGGAQSIFFGTWATGAAWSTIKVPLAIAALRADSASAESAASLAITQSDNDSADQLWAMLGEPADAGAQIEAVLNEAGDRGVAIQTQQVRPPYSPYGQTEWSLEQAARFAFGLPCVRGSDLVVASMRNIAVDQQWGLAGDNGVAAKGGWGPEPDGGYLVRQLGFIGEGPNALGFAIAAKPADGDFATGTSTLDELGDWILDHREQLPKGSCS